MLAQFTQSSLVTFRLIFKFVQRLPGFDRFPRWDQMAMAHAGSRKMILLRAARCFNPLNNTVVFSSEVAYDLQAYKKVGLDYRDFFHFCRKVHRLAVDPTEFALLSALLIFTDSPVIDARDQMDHVQSIYMTALVSHAYSNRSHPGVELAGLLGLLQDLRGGRF